jgi:mono/diheme cytochrome c family protein
MNATSSKLRRAVLSAALLAGSAGAVVHADDSSFLPEGQLGDLGGAQIYGHICQGCHMPAAQGAIGAGHYPKLAGDPALVSWQYAALTVLNGKNGMPGFGESSQGAGPFRAVHLSDAQIADVVNYVRNNFGNRYRSKVTAQQVAALPHPSTAADRSSQ